MSDQITADRLESARAFGRLTATREGRERLQRAGFRSGMPVVPAEWDETLGAVIRRVVSTPRQPALIAVRNSTDSHISFVLVGPSDPSEPVDQEAGGTASIGMLVDALAHTAARWNVRLNSWTAAQAQVIEPMGQPVLA